MSKYAIDVVHFLKNMKKYHHFEYMKHHIREKITFVLIMMALIILSFENLTTYAEDLRELNCAQVI